MSATRSCRLCGRAAPVLFVKDGFALRRCRPCAFGFVDEPPGPADLRRLYGPEFFRGAGRGGYMDYLGERKARRIGFLRQLDYVESRLSGGSLLDVGCADGQFLSLFDRGRWEVAGVEVSEAILERVPAALRGRTFHGTFEELPAAPGSFDVVTLWDVVDHLPDALAALQKAAALLKPGGLLGLCAGDMDSALARLMGRRWYLYLPPVHLSYFTERSMRLALASCGLETLRLAREPKWATLRHCLAHARFLLPWSGWRRSLESLLPRLPADWMIPFYGGDVMTVWARKACADHRN